MAQGRLRRLVTRRRLKRTGTVLTSLVLTILVASKWYYVSYDYDNARSGGAGITVCCGTVHLSWFRYSGPRTDSWPPNGFEYGSLSPTILIWRPFWESRKNPSASSVSVTRVLLPLWMPLAPLVLLTAYLWYTDRRAKPWQCPKCRYDLRGLDDGAVCPECGHELKPSNAEGVAD